MERQESTPYIGSRDIVIKPSDPLITEIRFYDPIEISYWTEIAQKRFPESDGTTLADKVTQELSEAIVEYNEIKARNREAVQDAIDVETDVFSRGFIAPKTPEGTRAYNLRSRILALRKMEQALSPKLK